MVENGGQSPHEKLKKILTTFEHMNAERSVVVNQQGEQLSSIADELLRYGQDMAENPNNVNLDRAMQILDPNTGAEWRNTTLSDEVRSIMRKQDVRNWKAPI